MINIFIANLDFEITSDDLKATFSQFGEVSYAHVVYEKKTKRSKGYGYVEMENEEEALRAIQALNGMEVKGRALDIKLATPKAERTPSKPSFDKVKKKTKFSPRVKETPRPPKDSTTEVRRVLRPRRKRNED